MTKPPVVFAPGCCARSGKSITGEEWVWLGDGAGQRLYHPPDVSGWDDERWLDSNTIRGALGHRQLRRRRPHVAPSSATARAYPAETPEQAVAAGPRVLARPAPGAGDRRRGCSRYAREFQPPADDREHPAVAARAARPLRAQRQNALRHLIAVSADYQTC